MNGNEVRAVAKHLVEILECLELPYCLIGGLVVPVWGIPRATYDLDLTVNLGAAESERLLAAVQAEGFDVPPEFHAGFRDRVAGMEKVTLTWPSESGVAIPVDLFWVTTPYQRASFSRRRRVPLNGWSAWVLSPADLILHKLIAGRPKDLADIQNVLLVQGIPDEVYLREWAHRLEVRDRLDRALRDSG